MTTLLNAIFLETSITDIIFSNVSIVDVINVYGAVFGNTFSEILTKQMCNNFGPIEHAGSKQHRKNTFTKCGACGKTRCNDCEWLLDRDFDRCNKCTTILCPPCIKKCGRCYGKNVVCQKHLKKCSDCRIKICEKNCVKRCVFCASPEFKCSNCFDHCSKCYKRMCSNCKHYCEGCLFHNNKRKFCVQCIGGEH